MKISKRLRVIGELVTDNSFILDIGCDHALLDIYVVKNKKNIKAIASDINEKPLKIAKENIKKYTVKNIKITKKDGLESYEEGVDTIILSGLGSKTIVNILKKDKEVLNKIDKLIISSNNDYYFLRKSICSLGFKIETEKIVLDKDKYYPIIVFIKGKEKYNNFELKYGPVLLKGEDKVFKDYLKLNKKKLVKIYNSLGNKYILKKIKIKKEIKNLRKYT
ncbi:MAG: tRNA (adenine(22)-N(1))-methyltransferase [Bacilli bacterium]